MERVNSMVAERPVVIFSRSNCGICHSIKSLISGYGANAVVYELDEISRGKEIEQALARRLGQNPAIPAVFVSGELVGGANEVMTLHLGGILRQMLMKAGALWV